MFRRSRFSIRPNVGVVGRTAATSQEAPPVNQEASETPKDAGESATAAAVTDSTSAATPSEKPTAPGDGNDQNGEGASSSAALQRRKRFSVKPKVAPGRPAALARTPKSPAKAASETPATETATVEVPGSDLDKPTTSSQTGTRAPEGLRSPRRRRPSEDSKQPKVQPKPSLVSSDSPGPSTLPLAEDSQEQTHLSVGSSKLSDSTSDGQIKEVPLRLPDKVPYSIPDREAIELSEKARTLVSSKNRLSPSPPGFSLSRLLNDPSDIQRLEKARKLRELLKQEMHKEKKLKKYKARAKEYTLDPAKMTMRDLIRYLPMSNPMTSSLEDSAQENETVVPPSPERAESPERAQEPEVIPKIASPREELEEEEEAPAAAAAAAEEDEDEEQDDSLMVPQVKVAEDGSLIIDEESLTVEVMRAKGPNPAQGRDPIFERGSTTTYSSFRKATYSKPWSSEETDMFFLAISMVGTDFSMICQLFPHRPRSEIKNKFKKEERENAWRIDKAFRERRKLDIEYFSKLLEKILEVQKSRKKLKSLSDKNSPRKRKRKTKGKKATRKLSDVEEEEEEEEGELPDFEEEEEGEKENEDLCNEGGTPVSKPKRKRKRKNEKDASTEEMNDKNKQTDEKSNEQDDASMPEDVETVQPPKPTRYGRVPKPTKHLNYLAKEDGHSSASETTPASPARTAAAAASDAKPKAKCAAKRTRLSKPKPVQESKRPKLVTLRASNSDYSDDEDGNQTEIKEVEDPWPVCSSAKDSSAPAFVPDILKSPQPEIIEVETMDELDILANMPDVLGISQDALCPDASCERAQNETGTAEPCEHQLDLLVDVIDFLSSEHTEVSEDASYNEAAQTLLTISNLTHLSQSAPNQTTTQDHITVITSVDVNETSQLIEEEIAAMAVAHEEASATPSVSAATGHGLTETSETVATVEPQNSATDKEPLSQTGEANIIKSNDQTSSEQKTVSDTESAPQLQSGPEISNKDSPQTKRGRLSKVKPKPNLGRPSRTALSKSQPDTSTQRTAEKSQTIAPDLSQPTEIQPAAEVTTLKLSESRPALIKDDISSENQSQTFSGAQFEPILEPATTDTTSADEKLTSHAGIIESVCNIPAASETAVTESQVEQGSTTDSATVQESRDGDAASVAPAEELPVCQKEESEGASDNQTRKSRFQKVKPKPKLPQTSRTVRSKPQTTEDPPEKDTSSSSNLESTDKTTAEVESQPTCTTCPEKPNPSVSIPSLDSGSTLKPTEEPSSIEEIKTVDRVDSGAETLGQSDPEAQSEPSEQATRSIGSRSESKDEKVTSHAETTASSLNNPATSKSAITESEVKRGDESSGNPAACDTPVEELPVSQKEGSEVEPTCPTRRSRLTKVKPNLPQTSRTARSKPQTTKEPVEYTQIVEKTSSLTSEPEYSHNKVAEVEPQPTCSTASPEKPQSTASFVVPSMELGSTHEPTQESSSTEEKNTNVGLQLDSSSDASEQNVSQRRRRLAKAKPNLGISTRVTQPKSQPKEIGTFSTQQSTNVNVTSEQQPVANESGQTKLESIEKDEKHLTSPHSEKSLNSTNDKGSSSDTIVVATSSVAESQSILTDTAAADKSSAKPTVEGESTGDSTSSHNKVEASTDGSAEPKIYLSESILPANVQSTPDLTEETAQQQQSEIKSQDSVQHGFETTEANLTANDKSQAPKSSDDTQSPIKSPQARRGRLIKPKPNLGRSSSRSQQPQQPQQPLNTTQAETDSCTHSEDVNASGSHGSVTELKPAIQEPVEGAIEQLSNEESPPNDAGIASGCETEAPENSTLQPQDASTSSTAREESSEVSESITILPEMLSVPSDPDEPFFILSLTEIPVCSSGEVVDSTSEPLPYLPVTDASMQPQSSVPGESAAAEGHVALSNVLEPVSSEPTGETSLISVKDTGPESFAFTSPTKENPVDPQESTTVQPTKSSSTVEKSEETKTPTTKQRLAGTGRRAKLQVKPSTTRTKQASKTSAAKEAELIPIQENTIQDSEVPGPSVQPEAFDAKASKEVVTEPQKGSSDHVDIEKETDGKTPEDSSSGAQARGTSSQTRKPKGFLCFLSEPDSSAPSNSPRRGKAASKGPKVKPQHVARPRSTPAPVASTSRDITPIPTVTQMPEEPCSASSTTSPTDTEVEQTAEQSRLHSESPPSTPSTSQCVAEVSVSQQSDCVESGSIQEEPTSVSQYFLSDIFTEVEEG